MTIFDPPHNIRYVPSGAYYSEYERGKEKMLDLHFVLR